MSSTIVEISLGALQHNIQAVQRTLPAHTGIIAVVKANAYGHGMPIVARAALQAGAAYLAVARLEEGLLLREEGIDAPILVIGGLFAEQIHEALANQLILTVFTPQMVQDIAAVCRAQGCKARVHIKIETGMGRIGAAPGSQLAAVIQAIQANPAIELDGMFSHLSVADDTKQDAFTAAQAAVFERAVQQMHATGLFPKLHLANSAGSMRGVGIKLDMVRLGIAMYGLAPDGSLNDDLQPVLRWKTRVVHTKWVAPGQSIGYGRTFIASKPTLVATLPVGYADGYHRSFAHKGYVLIRGQQAPILGNVCMDQCMVDITDIGDVVSVGEEAVLLGRQGTAEITATQLAQWAGTIHYEIVTGIGVRVLRVACP